MDASTFDPPTTVPAAEYYPELNDSIIQADEGENQTDILKLVLYDLNSAIAPRDIRLMAIRSALDEFDHHDELLHDEELELRADHILFQKLAYALMMDPGSDEVGYICSAMEMVYRASKKRLAKSFHDISEALLPVFVDMIRPPPSWDFNRENRKQQQWSPKNGIEMEDKVANGTEEQKDQIFFDMTNKGGSQSSDRSSAPFMEELSNPDMTAQEIDDDESAESVTNNTIPSQAEEYVEEMNKAGSATSSRSSDHDPSIQDARSQSRRRGFPRKVAPAMESVREEGPQTTSATAADSNIRRQLQRILKQPLPSHTTQQPQYEGQYWSTQEARFNSSSQMPQGQKQPFRQHQEQQPMPSQQPGQYQQSPPTSQNQQYDQQQPTGQFFLQQRPETQVPPGPPSYQQQSQIPPQQSDQYQQPYPTPQGNNVPYPQQQPTMPQEDQQTYQQQTQMPPQQFDQYQHQSSMPQGNIPYPPQQPPMQQGQPVQYVQQPGQYGHQQQMPMPQQVPPPQPPNEMPLPPTQYPLPGNNQQPDTGCTIPSTTVTQNESIAKDLEEANRLLGRRNSQDRKASYTNPSSRRSSANSRASITMEGHWQGGEGEDSAMRLRGGGRSSPSEEESYDGHSQRTDHHSEGRDQFDVRFPDRRFGSAAQGSNSSRFRSNINFDPSLNEGSTMSESMYSTDNPFSDSQSEVFRDSGLYAYGGNVGNSGGRIRGNSHAPSANSGTSTQQDAYSDGVSNLSTSDRLGGGNSQQVRGSESDFVLPHRVARYDNVSDFHDSFQDDGADYLGSNAGVDENVGGEYNPFRRDSAPSSQSEDQDYNKIYIPQKNDDSVSNLTDTVQGKPEIHGQPKFRADSRPLHGNIDENEEYPGVTFNQRSANEHDGRFSARDKNTPAFHDQRSDPSNDANESNPFYSTDGRLNEVYSMDRVHATQEDNPFHHNSVAGSDGGFESSSNVDSYYDAQSNDIPPHGIGGFDDEDNDTTGDHFENNQSTAAPGVGGSDDNVQQSHYDTDSPHYGVGVSENNDGARGVYNDSSYANMGTSTSQGRHAGAGAYEGGTVDHGEFYSTTGDFNMNSSHARGRGVNEFDDRTVDHGDFYSTTGELYAGSNRTHDGMKSASDDFGNEPRTGQHPTYEEPHDNVNGSRGCGDQFYDTVSRAEGYGEDAPSQYGAQRGNRFMNQQYNGHNLREDILGQQENSQPNPNEDYHHSASVEDISHLEKTMYENESNNGMNGVNLQKSQENFGNIFVEDVGKPDTEMGIRNDDIFQFNEPRKKSMAPGDYYGDESDCARVCPLAVQKVLKILRYFSRVLSAMEPLAQQVGLVDSLLYQMVKRPHSLYDEDDNAARVDAIAVIVNLACAEENKIMLVYHPGLLDVVVNVANFDPIDEAREHAAIVIMNLAYAEENKVHMVNQDHLLDTLIHLLFDVSPFTRRYASAALFTLACTYANTAVMSRHCDGGILEALRKVLLNDPIDEARVNAAEALFNMARNNSDDTVENMGNHPKLLASLAHSVLTDYSAEVRAYSARALEWLAADIHHPMVCHPALLKALTTASQWTKTTCIAEALKMQSSLSENRKAMVEHDGLLDALAALALLDDVNDDELKICAITALERLSKEVSTRQIMARHEGVITALTKATFSRTGFDEDDNERGAPMLLLMKTALKNLAEYL